MNCQEAIEKLPWWLNGSLEHEERREVEDHLAGCASCREALGETRLAWEVYAQHVPTEALVAYADDEQPPGIDPALLERHLEDCPQCAAELEMARASRLLSEHGEVPLLVPRQAAPARTPRRERGWQAAALAAGLTGLVAIGGWVGSVQQLHRIERAPERAVLRGSTEIAGGPAVAVHPIGGDLHPVNGPATRAGSSVEAAPPVELSKSREGTFLFQPRLADTRRENAYEILDGSGASLARGTLPANPLGAYVVSVKDLRPDDYVLQIYGTEGGARKPADRFLFRIKK